MRGLAVIALAGCTAATMASSTSEPMCVAGREDRLGTCRLNRLTCSCNADGSRRDDDCVGYQLGCNSACMLVERNGKTTPYDLDASFKAGACDCKCVGYNGDIECADAGDVGICLLKAH